MQMYIRRKLRKTSLIPRVNIFHCPKRTLVDLHLSSFNARGRRQLCKTRPLLLQQSPLHHAVRRWIHFQCVYASSAFNSLSARLPENIFEFARVRFVTVRVATLHAHTLGILVSFCSAERNSSAGASQLLRCFE